MPRNSELTAFSRRASARPPAAAGAPARLRRSARAIAFSLWLYRHAAVFLTASNSPGARAVSARAYSQVRFQLTAGLDRPRVGVDPRCLPSEPRRGEQEGAASGAHVDELRAGAQAKMPDRHLQRRCVAACQGDEPSSDSPGQVQIHVIAIDQISVRQSAPHLPEPQATRRRRRAVVRVVAAVSPSDGLFFRPGVDIEAMTAPTPPQFPGARGDPEDEVMNIRVNECAILDTAQGEATEVLAVRAGPGIHAYSCVQHSRTVHPVSQRPDPMMLAMTNPAHG